MAVMGSFCKAYMVDRLRLFPGWQAQSIALPQPANLQKKEQRESVATDDDEILYLQENYTVTAGIFLDESIVFSQVTPEWKEFCDSVLGFAAARNE